jgi:hypothetical protein
MIQAPGPVRKPNPQWGRGLGHRGLGIACRITDARRLVEIAIVTKRR